MKPAEDGHGIIVRISSPTSTPLPTALQLPDGTVVQECRLDESPAAGDTLPAATGAQPTWTMPPYALSTAAPHPSVS